MTPNQSKVNMASNRRPGRWKVRTQMPFRWRFFTGAGSLYTEKRGQSSVVGQFGQRVEQAFGPAGGFCSAGVPPARWAGKARQCFAARKVSTTEGETPSGQPAGCRRYFLAAPPKQV